MPARRRAEVLGALFGVLGACLITAVVFQFGNSLPVTIPALLLLVPISLASGWAGWRVGVGVAVVSATLYALAFLPPIGHVRIGLTEDVYVLLTFVAVAVVVGILSAHRTITTEPELLDARRAMLLRSVSHDLRNPLSTIHAVSSELLDSGEYDESTRNSMIGLVVDESQRLDRIVGNLLSLSRIQSGSFAPHAEPIPLRPIVEASAARIDRGKRIVTDLEPDLPDVRADVVQIDQVLTNLIENALKAAPADTTVTITARREADFVHVAVIDRGPGFGSDVLDGLFETPRSTTGSTGLGLTLCSAIVQAHGGRILAFNNLDAGATVAFTLPVDEFDGADAAHD